MTRELHPEARATLDRLSDAGAPPLHTLSVEGARQLLLDLSDTEPAPVANETVLDLQIPGPEGSISVRTYRPTSVDPDADERLPVLVYLHGGGWALGGLDSVDALCRLLAVEAGVLVLSVSYRRPPEEPFPAAVRDAYAAVEWVAEHGATIGGDPNRLAVGGDSAGGNLAAAVTLVARDFEGPSLVAQLLVYPVVDHAFDTASYEENATGYYLTRDDMRQFWEWYLDDPLHGSNPYASPLRHPDHRDLPPAYVLTCEFDPLRDEGRAYADRLRDAGVSVEYVELDGMIHGFFRHVTRLSTARDAALEATTFLEKWL